MAAQMDGNVEAVRTARNMAAGLLDGTVHRPARTRA
jgi:hypothetical protein